MLYAEWSGKRVDVRMHTKQIVRTLHARDTVVGVQCSGNGLDDGMVAITMTNGKTDLYRANGQIVRRG